MEIEIRKLTPDMAEDYVQFFTDTPHDDNIDEHKCYCVCCVTTTMRARTFQTAEKKKPVGFAICEGYKHSSYLAYRGDAIVGWCNANTKSDCLKCVGWQRMMSDVLWKSPATV